MFQLQKVVLLTQNSQNYTNLVHNFTRRHPLPKIYLNRQTVIKLTLYSATKSKEKEKKKLDNIYRCIVTTTINIK